MKRGSKVKKCVIVLYALVIIVLGFILVDKVFLNENDKEEKTSTENLKEESEKKKRNENLDEDLVNLIYEKGNILDYFNQDNLEYFEILNIINFGYFESKSNIRYMQVNYDFKCKDGTRSCNLLEERIDYIEFFSFQIAIDLNNDKYIEINPEYTIHINSDWIST